MCKICLSLTGGLLISAVLAVGQAVAEEPSLFAPHPAAPSVEKSPPAEANISPPSSTVRTKPAATESKPEMRLNVTLGPSDDPAAVYEDYFSHHTVDSLAVLNKVHHLLNLAKTHPQRHEEIIALLEAAIRNGQAQPWMYEALALSMEMAKRPAKDVERVLMSLADFTTNPNQLMRLAQYMARLGHDARALQLFRQASALAPSRTEPFEYGLEVARRLDDPDGIRWATLGVLRQAWPREKADLQRTARYAAAALIEKLHTTGRTAEADAFAAELTEATARDVVVRVSWEGDADVDVMVQEPGGSVCSLRDRRTTAGGVLVGDSDSQIDPSSSTGSSETYICPKGFAGTYKLWLRLVWGKIPAGKVTVELTTRNADGHPQQVRQQIPLDERNSLVSFTVSNGRRHEPLDLQQVAVDAQQQLAVNRAVLAQQIAALSDPAAIAAQQIAAQTQTPFVTGFTPVLGAGAVGFQPQITLLPSGVTMSANAVISADRRYVRITALPFFSSVGNVSTFTIAQPTFQVGF